MLLRELGLTAYFPAVAPGGSCGRLSGRARHIACYESPETADRPAQRRRAALRAAARVRVPLRRRRIVEAFPTVARAGAARAAASSRGVSPVRRGDRLVWRPDTRVCRAARFGQDAGARRAAARHRLRCARRSRSCRRRDPRGGRGLLRAWDHRAGAAPADDAHLLRSRPRHTSADAGELMPAATDSCSNPGAALR